MYLYVTVKTKWNYIKPVFFFVTPMVIMSSLITTFLTFLGRYTGNDTILNCLVSSMSSLFSNYISSSMPFTLITTVKFTLFSFKKVFLSFISIYFTLLRLCIKAYRFFSLSSSRVFGLALSTPILQSIGCFLVISKILCELPFFASSTLFHLTSKLKHPWQLIIRLLPHEQTITRGDLLDYWDNRLCSCGNKIIT